jgi:hypothetical protein
MEVTTNRNILILSGVLNEQTKFDALRAAMEQGRTASPDGRVVLDLSGVPMANSIGILHYLRFLASFAHPPLTYVNTPPWLVEQLGFLEEFIDEETIVASIQAPYYSPSGDESELVLLTLGVDVPIQESYDDFRPVMTINGVAFEPDFEPESFFYFITRHIERFRMHFPKQS